MCDPFSQITEVKPELELVRIAIVIPHTRSAVDTELRDRAVPGNADDVARTPLLRIRIGRVTHVFPERFVLLVGCLRLTRQLLQNPSALPGFKLLLVLCQADRLLSSADKNVQ